MRINDNEENFNSTWDVQSAAIWYFTKLNWRIFPTGRNKIPLIGWSKYRTVKPTVEEVTQWFAQFPTANIGLITGESTDVVVIDIDPRHNGTDEDFKDIKTVKSKTGGGGFHLFFKYEAGLVNKAGIKEGIDVRAEGGYVVLPPSIHESGNKYEWINSPDTTPLAPLPDFVKNWFKKSKTNSKSNWNPNILDGTKEGNRNESAASVAGKLLKRFPEGEWETEAYTHFKNWNSQNKPPLSDKELRAVFESIIEREKVSRKGKDESQPSGTETPVTIPCSFEELKKEVELFLPNTSIALQIMLAVATSGVRRNPVMLWVLFVGAPSSGKTELLKLIKKNRNVLSLDTLTQNSFISGERITKTNKVYDLLDQLNNTCLVVKDWTAVFSTDERQTKKIVGDLVGIYDKSFEKFSSARGKISYDAEFSHLGAITPATLNKHHNYLNMIGARFLFYSIPCLSKDAEEKSFTAIFAKEDRKIQEQKVSLLVNEYLTYLNTNPINQIEQLSDDFQEYFKTAARFLARGRGIVIMQPSSFKAEDGNEITYYESSENQIEQPFRAIQQLIILAEYLAFVAGKTRIGEEELLIIKEIVIGSMPADRSQALRALKAAENGEITAQQLKDNTDKSNKTARRLLEELCHLELVEKVKGSGTIASSYNLTEEFKQFILGTPREFMSHKEDSGTETPHSIDQANLAEANPTTPTTFPSSAEKSEIEITEQEKELVKIFFDGDWNKYRSSLNND